MSEIRDCEYGDYKYMNNDVSPYELIDESLNKRCRDSISASYTDWYKMWREDIADYYFDTSEWGDAEWVAWKEYLEDIL